MTMNYDRTSALPSQSFYRLAGSSLMPIHPKVTAKMIQFPWLIWVVGGKKDVLFFRVKD